MDFLGGRLVGARDLIFGGDQYPAQLADHVGGGGVGLGGVSGGLVAVVGDVGGGVTDGGIPQHGEGLAGQAERGTVRSTA